MKNICLNWDLNLSGEKLEISGKYRGDSKCI